MARTFYISVEKRGTVTNGDVIKALFNPYKICEYEYSVHVYMKEKDFWKSEYMNCDTSWWNAPYKAESEDNMKANEIKEGMNFYDSLNGRSIKVESIDKNSKTAICIVSEPSEDYSGDDGDDDITYDTHYSLFNLNELLHFKRG